MTDSDDRQRFERTVEALKARDPAGFDSVVRDLEAMQGKGIDDMDPLTAMEMIVRLEDERQPG